MKKFLLAGLAVTLVGSAALPAAAADFRGERRIEQRQDRHDFRQDGRQDHRTFQQAQRRFHAGTYQAPRGYKAQRWGVGQRLPRGYYGSPYAIRDYRSYGLYAPPAGYQWTRVGDDAVLTAVASGLIGAVIGGLFF